VVVGGGAVVDGGGCVDVVVAVVVDGTVVAVTVRHFGLPGLRTHGSGFPRETAPPDNTPTVAITTAAATMSGRRIRYRYSSHTAYTWHACPVPFSTTTPTPFAAPTGIRIPASPNVQITPAPIAAPNAAR
jgi:hypothetical protein